MEAQSQVERGEVILSPGHASRSEVTLGFKPQTAAEGWGW